MMPFPFSKNNQEVSRNFELTEKVSQEAALAFVQQATVQDAKKIKSSDLLITHLLQVAPDNRFEALELIVGTILTPHRNAEMCAKAFQHIRSEREKGNLFDWEPALHALYSSDRECYGAYIRRSEYGNTIQRTA
jgi:hypothetical protein